MFLATFESAHFTFRAWSDTREGAREALKRGWNVHRTERQEHSGTVLYTWDEIAEDVCVRPMHQGTCYRDDTALGPDPEGVVEDALLAFWGAVAKAYPSATSGDLAPEIDAALTTEARAAIASWVDYNVPTGGSS